jgi:hypothetical protein
MRPGSRSALCILCISYIADLSAAINAAHYSGSNTRRRAISAQPLVARHIEIFSSADQGWSKDLGYEYRLRAEGKARAPRP